MGDVKKKEGGRRGPKQLPSVLDTWSADVLAALPALPCINGSNPSAENRSSRLPTAVVKVEPTSECGGDHVPIKPGWRKCSKAGCPTKTSCSLGIAKGCGGSGPSARWLHISLTEHYCNTCFEHFYRRAGQPEFQEWELEWSRHSSSKPLVSAFICHQKVPYWVRCAAPRCGKWRKVKASLKVTPDVISTFLCGAETMDSVQSCADPEDETVLEVLQGHWWKWCTHNVLLEYSPAALFRPKTILPGRIGLSPMANGVNGAIPTDLLHHKYLEPFNLDPSDPMVVQGRFCMDSMDASERDTFSHLLPGHSISYLALRNLVMALWATNVSEWLTTEKCMQHLICRGMIRIRLEQELEGVLWFLTSQGIINCGLLRPPPSHSFIVPSNQKCHVVVIGAGASGLAAAKRLQDFNVKVTVLEAGVCIGGRVRDVISSGVAVGQGAQLLNNLINNPLSLACLQAGLELQEMGEECTLFRPDGQLVDPQVCRQINFHFEGILDFIGLWRRERKLDQDKSVQERFSTEQKTVEDGISIGKSLKKERLLIEFFMGNLECAVGAPLDRLSVMNWDQNEEMPQFSGTVGLVVPGYQSVLHGLASDLNIYFHTQVNCIDYRAEQVVVKTTTGEELHADKVIVTVPLTVLKSGVLQFNPALPSEKTAAIQTLGAGLVEKISLKFVRNFWRKHVDNNGFFGCVPPFSELRGLFNYFYCLPPSEEDGSQVVVGVTGGNALWDIKDLSDSEIKDLSMKVLRSMACDENVPEPCWYHVTHWGLDPLAGMSYSYLPVGVDGSTYDIMAKCVGERIHFAGEATNRQFPQTVTGAYLSGLREASLILSELHHGN